jgi:branched-chain amino acid transport system substrate-binding protein
MDAGATVAALAENKPDAIYNVTFGADLTNFVRQGNTRGLFEGKGVVSVLTGEPEYLDPLGSETPTGWVVTGYPVNSVSDPANKAFIDAYMAKYKEQPKMGSVVGYALINSIVAGIKKTGSVDSEKMADGFGGSSFATPFGSATWRAIDHQSTMGTYVGKTALKDGKPVMVDWHYANGADALPSDAEVKKMRPA